MLVALIMVAGVALAVTAVFDQPEGTSGRDALMLVLPGAAVIAGIGSGTEVPDPDAFALALATILCPWAGFYIGWRRAGRPGTSGDERRHGPSADSRGDSRVLRKAGDERHRHPRSRTGPADGP